MFIDADKENMSNYYEWGLKLLRRGGLLIVDNVLWGDSVVDPSDQTPSTVAIRAFNDLVRRDPRTDSVMINVADGLHLCRKV
jgi:predicted O-methyltransferase YrrM